MTEVESIRARHLSARPKPAIDPAWANAEHDIGLLLKEYDALAETLEAAECLLRAIEIDNAYWREKRDEYFALETPVSTLCAVCDQIKELHPATHPWTARTTSETGAQLVVSQTVKRIAEEAGLGEGLVENKLLPETNWPPVKPGYCPNMGHKRYNMPYCTECPPEKTTVKP